MDKSSSAVAQTTPSLAHVHHNGHHPEQPIRNGSVCSKIPRFQRSQSLRVKGERVLPTRPTANRNSLSDCDHLLERELLADVERRSRGDHQAALTLANLRTCQPTVVTATLNGNSNGSGSSTRYVPCQRLHGPYGPCPNQQMSAHSSSTTLTRGSTVESRSRRPASLVGLSSSGSNAVQPPQHRKASSPSEYGSLPSTPIPSPDAEDDDDGSVKSFRSFCSAVSFDTYHHQTALGVRGRVAGVGSARKKYAVHCPSHLSEDEEYLTPTQRKDRLIRQLKAMLVRAKRELDEKDAEIERLSKELLQIKHYKQEPIDAPNTSSGGSNNNSNQPATPLTSTAAPVADLSVDNPRELNRRTFSSVSTQDSGHCESSTSTSSAGSGAEQHQSSADVRDSPATVAGVAANGYGELYSPLNALLGFSLDECLKREIEQVKRHHSTEYQELKERYNDRIENLLQKLSEANTRYFDLRPKYDYAQERIRLLEKQCQSLEKQLSDDDKRHNQMYLKMYKKGQEAAKFEHADEVLEFAHHAPTRVSVPELLQQLKVTEHELHQVKSLYRREIYKQTDSMERDSEITLRFLKDAIYHFLTNKESRDHLKAIESIMGYSESERHNIEKSIFSKNKFM